MGTTTTDDAFHEIQLNGKQLVFLFMSTVVILVVVFLFGVLVGRNIQDDRAPVEALAQPEPAPAVADTAPAAAPPSGAPTAEKEELSYPDRLTTEKPVPETLKTAKPAPPAPAARAMPDAAPAKSTSGSRAGFAEPAGAGFAIQVAALRQRAEADSVARTLTTKGYPAYVMNPETGAPAVFRVRVGKFKDRSEAETVAARLQKEEQFKPWIVR